MLRTLPLLALGTLAVAVHASARSRSDPVEVALVANAGAGTVTLVDIAARTIIGSIDINPTGASGDGPGARNYAQDTDLSPDGRTLYVSRGYLKDVAAFELPSGRMLWATPLNTGRADHMTISRDGRSLFVSAMLDNRVYRITAATGALAGHVVTGVYPHDNKISKDGRRLYNSSIGPIANLPRPAGAPPLTEQPGDPFQMTIIDVATLAVTDRIRFETGVRPWEFAPDERSIYTQLSNEHAVVHYDLVARKVIRRLELPVTPGITPADWDFEAPHHGLALTHDGKTLCLAGRASDYVALVKAPELTLIATIPAGDAPGWSEVSGDGKTCLAVNSRSNDLSIISIPDKVEVVRLPMPRGPKHITVARMPASVLEEIRKTR